MIEISDSDVLALSNHSIATLLVTVDDGGTIAWSNAAAEKIFAYFYGELTGMALDKLVPDRFRAEHPANRAKYNANPSIRPMGIGRPVRGRKKDGTEFDAVVMLSPGTIRQVSYVLAAVFDMTGKPPLHSDVAKGD